MNYSSVGIAFLDMMHFLSERRDSFYIFEKIILKMDFKVVTYYFFKEK